MKTTVVQWFQWFGEAMTHALGSFNDRHLQPPPIGTQPYRDTPDKRARDYGAPGCLSRSVQRKQLASATAFRSTLARSLRSAMVRATRNS